jgi:uncharacterized membrane protein YagU involved in acid resistance
MVSDTSEPTISAHEAEIEMPRATIAPLILSLGIAMLAAGTITSPVFLIVGGVIGIAGLSLWIVQLQPGHGHFHERFVPVAQRPSMISSRPSAVEHLQSGMPGYRLRLPMEIHPISAGVRGGIVGGLVMPVPALAYGVISGHGIWYPINLLSGMVLPGIGRLTIAELEQFRLSFLLLGTFIHAVLSIVFGMIYGVLLPTLPPIPRPLAWGGLLMPLLWTGVSFAVMGSVNPLLAKGVDWSWFIASQFFFGVAAAIVVTRAGSVHPILAGLKGGLAGGLVMAIPALLWSLITGHGIWYPANLLAGMVLPGLGSKPIADIMQFRGQWLIIAIVVHIVMSTSFGIIYALLLPVLRPIPSPLAWGGLLLPLLWTATSHSLMGVVNPLLQKRVDWPWFVISQFVFGVVTAIVVLRSEKVYIAPIGRGLP